MGQSDITTKENTFMLFNRFCCGAVLASMFFVQAIALADQFVIFDKTFVFEEKDAIPTKSHLTVEGGELNKRTPQDWTSPLNYAEGTVHVLIDVLDKPDGDVPTYWSICYIAKKGQNGSRYACTSSPKYKKPGTYQVVQDMKKLWQKDTVVWTQGLEKMTLVLKGPPINNGPKGKSHAHLQPDLKKFFPTKIRFRIVQVSEGDKFDAATLNGK